MRLVPLLILLLLAGCQTLTPNKAQAVSVEALVTISNEIDLAEKREWITKAEGYDLQTRILEILNFMVDGRLLVESLGCEPELTRNECMQKALIDVEFRFREAQL